MEMSLESRFQWASSFCPAHSSTFSSVDAANVDINVIYELQNIRPQARGLNYPRNQSSKTGGERAINGAGFAKTVRSALSLLHYLSPDPAPF